MERLANGGAQWSGEARPGLLGLLYGSAHGAATALETRLQPRPTKPKVDSRNETKTPQGRIVSIQMLGSMQIPAASLAMQTVCGSSVCLAKCTHQAWLNP